MLRMTMTLIPGGHGEPRELGRIDIENEGTSETSTRGNYFVRLFRRGDNSHVQRVAQVLDYPREAYTVWELGRRALAALFARGAMQESTAEPAAVDDEALQMALARLGNNAVSKDAAQGATEILATLEAIVDETDAGVRRDAIYALVPRLAVGDALCFLARDLGRAAREGNRPRVSTLLNGLEAASVAYDQARGR